MHSYYRSIYCSLGIALAALAAPHSNAAVRLEGDIFNAGGTFSITENITFDIQKSGSLNLNLVFAGWVTNDGDQSYLDIKFETPLLAQINSGYVREVENPYLVDNLTMTLGDISSHDGFLSLGEFYVTAGDTFTLFAGSWDTYIADEDFNPQALQTFTGEAFLLDINTAQRVSSIVSLASSGPAIPEPSTYAILAGTGALGFACWRRRKKG